MILSQDTFCSFLNTAALLQMSAAGRLHLRAQNYLSARGQELEEPHIKEVRLCVRIPLMSTGINHKIEAHGMQLLRNLNAGVVFKQKTFMAKRFSERKGLVSPVPARVDRSWARRLGHQQQGWADTATRSPSWDHGALLCK